MGRAYEEIRAAGADAVAIFQYRAEPSRNFCRRRGVPFDCLGDPGREAYAAVGLERGSLKEYLGPRLAVRGLRALRQGAAPGIPKGDVTQRPGTFVVDGEGKVVLAHYNEDSADNPPNERLLEAVRSAAGGAA